MSENSGRQNSQMQKTLSCSKMNTIKSQNSYSNPISNLILPKYYKLLSQIITNNFNV